MDRAKGSGSERGVALIMVIVVLMALMVIAVPFTISMRNQSRSATELLNDERARRDCELLKEEAVERIKDTHPGLDILTPGYDDASEWTREGGGREPAAPVPEGDGMIRISSTRVSDLQGRINLNTASIYLLANLFGHRTVLVEEAGAESTSLAVRDAASFPEEGLLWVEGDPFQYGSRKEDSFEDVRPCPELANLDSPPEALHPAGTEVLDYRSFLLATYCYKWQPGSFSTLPTKESIRNIAVYGEAALDRAALDALSPMVTVRSALPGGRRFVGAQRVLDAGAGKGERVLLVGNGRYMGAGSIIRVRCGDMIHYSLVIRSTPVDAHSWAVMLEEPLPFDVLSAGDAVVDVLARHPVNVNTASVEVLAACMEGLGLAGGRRRVHRDEALLIARRMKEKTLEGWLDLDALLRDLVARNDRISEFERQVVMMNALDANDAFLAGGTMPFTFSSGGYFSVETAVALDYRSSGREASRRFLREILAPAPRDRVTRIFHTQADFEEQRRLTRDGGGYLTLPVNLNRDEGDNDPPSLLGPVAAFGLEPSGEDDGAGLKLAPLRLEGERVLHMDTEPGLPSGGEPAAGGPEEPSGGGPPAPSSPAGGGSGLAGYSLMPGPGERPGEDPEGFVTGKKTIRLPLIDPPVSLLGGAFARVWPFSIDLWYRFDELGGEHDIFDAGLQEEFDRIYLFFDGKDLVFRVADVSEPVSALDPSCPIEHAEIRYDFSDLPLEKGIFYHITCMAKGTKPSDLCLFVDGVPRGRRSFQTRIVEPLESATPVFFSGDAPLVSPPSTRIKVADATRFPRRGVLRIGKELVEYNSRNDDTFFVKPDWKDRFGGRGSRLSRPEEHVETEIAELYGYSSLLASGKIPNGRVDLGERIGPFRVAVVDHEKVKDVPLNVVLSTGDSFQIGRGFDYDTISSLPLLAADGSSLKGDEFQKNGGFAVIFSDLNRTIKIKDPDDPNRTVDVRFTRVDSSRLQTPRGSLVDGFEVIRYDSFDGRALNGVTRGWAGGYPQGGRRKPPFMADPALNPSGENWGGRSPGGGTTSMSAEAQFIRKRAFWTENTLSAEGLEIKYPRVFVIPISVDVGAGSGVDLYDDFNSDPDVEKPRSQLVQIGLDFNGTGENETEWIRYNTVTGGRFVRDDPREVRKADSVLAPLCFGADAVVDPVALSERTSRMMNFRAQQGTPNASHAAGSPVLPVFRTVFNGEARPGRHDDITIVDYEGDRESARINYAAYNDRDYGPCNMIALSKGVLGDYRRVDIDKAELKKQLAGKEEGAVEEAMLTLWNLEARDFTRIVKFPSGELPATAPEEIVLGGNLYGDPSPSKGCIDEVRFGSFDTPHKDLPRFARYVLKEDLEEEATGNTFRLATDTLRYNYYTLRTQLLEEMDILGQIPGDASLMLIGDEIIACSEVDTGEGYVTFLPEGRGLFGTEPGFHAAGEPVVVLNFPVLSFLTDKMSPDAAGIPLSDTAGFPFSGCVLVDGELIGYDRRDKGFLSMPAYRPYGEGKPRGLFRGRFGTKPAGHYEGALVYLFPARYPDLYTPGADAPEEKGFPFGFEAPGAFYGGVDWIEESCGEGADLVVLGRVGGRGSWAEDPSKSKDIFFFEDPERGKHRNPVMRQGDLIELRVFTRYGAGAFDPVDFSANGWKRSPLLRALSVEYAEPTLVFRHDEWR